MDVDAPDGLTTDASLYLSERDYDREYIRDGEEEDKTKSKNRNKIARAGSAQGDDQNSCKFCPCKVSSIRDKRKIETKKPFRRSSLRSGKPPPRSSSRRLGCLSTERKV
jgi:hypothetical protein